MKACRFCGCSYWATDTPSWVVDEHEPLIGQAFSICPCPCHFRGKDQATYIEAVQEIFEEELYPEDGE